MGLCLSTDCDPVAMRLRSVAEDRADVDVPLPPPSVVKVLVDKVIKCVVTRVMAGNRCTIVFVEDGMFFRQPVCIDDCEPLLNSGAVPVLKSLVMSSSEPRPLLFARVVCTPPGLSHLAEAEAEEGEGEEETEERQEVVEASDARGGAQCRLRRAPKLHRYGTETHPDLRCSLFFDSRCRQSVADEMVRAGVATTIKDKVVIFRRGPFEIDETYAAIYFPPRPHRSTTRTSKGGRESSRSGSRHGSSSGSSGNKRPSR